MITILRHLLLLAFLLLFIACEKEYTCVCSNGGLGVDIFSETIIVANSKQEAMEACNDLVPPYAQIQVFCNLLE